MDIAESFLKILIIIGFFLNLILEWKIEWKKKENMANRIYSTGNYENDLLIIIF